MKDKKNVFDILIEKNICFSVIAAAQTFKNKGIDECSKDYFLIAKKSDVKGVVKGFSREDEDPNLYSKDLTDAEVRIFKKINVEKFDKVMHSHLGRVYELKGNSFKDYYRS